MHAKLVVDRSEETELVRAWYFHSRLRGKAVLQVNAWVMTAQETDRMTVEAIVQQLRLVYEDPKSTARAANKLGSLKQGTKSFATFIAEFERTILEAGGGDWADTAKRNFLSNGISDELRQAIIAVPMPETYQEYCSLLHGRTASARISRLTASTNGNRI
jgi:hypothetical protein